VSSPFTEGALIFRGRPPASAALADARTNGKRCGPPPRRRPILIYPLEHSFSLILFFLRCVAA
jgi:hypothetical protein